jgi:RHS repeat-associated protein
MTVTAKLLACALWAILCMGSAPVQSQTTSSLSPAGSTGTPACSGGDTGPVSPCTTHVASSGGTEVSLGAGNPLNVISGNKYQREDDLPALPGVFGLEIVRHYNSLHSHPGSPNGILGRGWRLSYETSLHVVGRTLQITQANGSRLIFSRDPFQPSLCATANPADGRIAIHKTLRGEEYVWTWSNGRKLDFDSKGKLIQILAPTGEFVTLDYNRQGWLHKVTDPQGRSLRLHYPDYAAVRRQRFSGVMAIDSPVGQFRYAHGSALPAGATLEPVYVLANLTKVVYPDGSARRYHYEEARHPTLLTGISGSDEQRIGTYGYNANGLAVLSVKGEPARYVNDQQGKPQLAEGTGIEQVALDFSEPGQTTLTNSVSQKTVYRHAMISGGLRLLEAIGAGCASCGEPNVRYGYDRLGRLIATAKLDASGKPIQSMERDLDYYGRILEVRRIVYWNGRPSKAQWLVRYRYREGNLQPTLIARPSVAPGKEYRTSITFNGQDQPIRITESGWTPAMDGASPPMPIARTTTYAYASINGRSLLARIDGPLPNGPTDSPVDSDITQIDWDGKGNAVTAITAPGGFRSTVAYDEAGRLIEAADPDGRKSSLTYGARNWLVATTVEGRTQRITYDANGNAIETGHGAGKAYKALIRLGFDAAGRTTWSASHLGILQQHRFDSEGKLLETSRQSASIRQSQRFAYDAAGRLNAVTDTHGATRRIRWNRDGLPEAMIDALGRETLYRYDAAGRLKEMTEAANTLHARLQGTTVRFNYDALGRTETVTAPNGAVTRYLRDDFSRTLAVSSSDSGTLTNKYDVANRLIAGRDANGNQTSYQYDAAGRIVKQTITEARTSQEPPKTTATHWKYQGNRLVALDHPDQVERYRYDEQGRPVTKVVTLRLAGNTPSTSFTHYRYDEPGRLVSISLPDGSALHYRRNGQNRVTAIERSRIHTPWLSWLLPARPLVKDVQRDIVGIKSYTYGNGIEARYQRSREGALARILHRHSQTESGQQSAALNMLFGIASAHAASADAPLNVTVALPGALSLPQDARALIDHRYLWDAEGNLLHTHDKDTVQNYAYDPQDRLIAAATTQSGQLNAAAAASRYARYFYDGTGNRLLSQEGMASQADIETGTVRSAYAASNSRLQGTTGQAQYDSSGQPSRLGKREYTWDAHGRLLAVRQEEHMLASYRYNHRGERIAKNARQQHTYFLYEDRKLIAELDDKGQLSRQYVYVADRPIAVIDTPDGAPLAKDTPSALLQIAADLRTIFRAWFFSEERIAYLHNNHLGATELITDIKGETVWKASYSPYGKVVQAAPTRKSGFTFQLRLPGQYEDEETGLYYNDHRYYDPAQGRYLTPDPLGLRAGINSYGYVNGNPLKYIDPSGLILFAFDGTGNTDDLKWLRKNNSSVSNVVKFRNLYDDGARRYISGVGTVDMSDPEQPIDPKDFQRLYTSPFDPATADMGINLSGPARISRMVKYFKEEADKFADDEAMDVDLIGFSRGAAQARDFANLIVASTQNSWYGYTDTQGKAQCQKVNFRFMGLWDTVLSTNHSRDYMLNIPDQFSYVAQAVALTEFRFKTGRNLSDSMGAFPLESIMGLAAPANVTRIERGFIGAHADIGGGFGEHESDLAKVALIWMVDQGRKAGVKMTVPDSTIIANPVLHDKSDNQLSTDGSPSAIYEDREVRYMDGKTTSQMAMKDTGMTFADTGQFISYLPADGPFVDGKVLRIPRPDFVTGTVDIKRYLEWLNLNGYNINLRVIP